METGEVAGVADERRMRLRYAGTCRLCGTDLPQGTRAVHERSSRTVRCLECPAGDAPVDAPVTEQPCARANIDHLVVSHRGVFVVDAKKYKGRPALRVEGGLFRPRTETLVVGGRTCTKLVDGVLKQVDLVRAALDDPQVPVVGVLCFVEAEWPLFGGAFQTRGVHILWPRRLGQLVAGTTTSTGDTAAVDVPSVHARLAKAFPPA